MSSLRKIIIHLLNGSDMINQNSLYHMKVLYEKIFSENVGESKEFTKFAAGNPNPLRIKVADWIDKNDPIIRAIPECDKIMSAYELDTMINDFIEENYI